MTKQSIVTGDHRGLLRPSAGGLAMTRIDWTIFVFGSRIDAGFVTYGGDMT